MTLIFSLNLYYNNIFYYRLHPSQLRNQLILLFHRVVYLPQHLQTFLGNIADLLSQFTQFLLSQLEVLEMVSVVSPNVQNFDQYHYFLKETLALALIVHLDDFLEDSVLEDVDVCLLDLLAEACQSQSELIESLNDLCFHLLEVNKQLFRHFLYPFWEKLLPILVLFVSLELSCKLFDEDTACGGVYLMGRTLRLVGSEALTASSLQMQHAEHVYSLHYPYCWPNQTTSMGSFC